MAQTWAYINDSEFTTDSNSANPSLPGFSVTTGNAILVGLLILSGTDYTSPSSLSDTAGNTYSQIATYDYLYSGTYRCRLHIYAAYNITGNASNAITINYSSTGRAIRCIAAQISGLATSSTQDTGYAPAGNVDTSSTYDSTSANTADADELVFGVFQNIGATITFSDGTGTAQEQVGAQSIMALATRHAASAGSIGLGVTGSGAGTVMILARAFKQAPAGTTYQQAVSGALPSPSGALSARVIFRQAISGDLPAPSGALLKKIIKHLSGDMPAPDAALGKKTFMRMAGDMPAADGGLVKKIMYHLLGAMPASTGAASGDLSNLSVQISGDFPAPAGDLSKKTIKALTGVMPAPVGQAVKVTHKALSGDFAEPAGITETAYATSQAIAGEMPAPTGLLSTVLNPIINATAKLLKMIGTSFKKMIGG